SIQLAAKVRNPLLVLQKPFIVPFGAVDRMAVSIQLWEVTRALFPVMHDLVSKIDNITRQAERGSRAWQYDHLWTHRLSTSPADTPGARHGLVRALASVPARRPSARHPAACRRHTLPSTRYLKAAAPHLQRRGLHSSSLQDRSPQPSLLQLLPSARRSRSGTV